MDFVYRSFLGLFLTDHDDCRPDTPDTIDDDDDDDDDDGDRASTSCVVEVYFCEHHM